MHHFQQLLIFGFLLFSFGLSGQPDFYDGIPITRADTLRGKLRFERTCYDVGHYDLRLELDIAHQSIRGSNRITYRINQDFKKLQIDLFANMVIDDILLDDGQKLTFNRVDNAVFVIFPRLQKKEAQIGAITVLYHGQPIIARNPPWDGGFSWTQDPDKNDWVVVSCEGIGASLWWPNKDHLSDEPDSMDIRITVPNTLQAISNGRLVEQRATAPGKTTFHWAVSYPINNYNVTLNVGNYAHFHEIYQALDGDSLDLDYYVLPRNLAKAKEHFKMVPEMLRIYEEYLGKYPFWKDGYALVETPTLGMEHQGAISYGNKYQRGYLGGRIPDDMKWDYIIVHESGHEYWGNSVSCNDLAEMWLHEGFTTYMEALYVEKRFGEYRAIEYLLDQRRNIQNSAPIVGKMDMNYSPMYATDQYYKGSWFLHTLRHVIDDDCVWFGMLQAYYRKYALSHVTTQEFIDFVQAYTGKDYSDFFMQYLYYPKPPTLEYSLTQKGKNLMVKYKWKVDVSRFDMPIVVGNLEKPIKIYPNNQEWKTLTIPRMKAKDFQVATSFFYVNTHQVMKRK